MKTQNQMNHQFVSNYIASGTQLSPGLYLVATPIGNLGDITLRGLTTLDMSDQIWCEDTRITRKLLSFYNITRDRNSVFSCHDHNETVMSKRLVENIAAGQSIAYVSDAGMPGISDPGYRLVQAVIDAQQAVHVLPGANAVLPALIYSGLPQERFAFWGFLPNKSNKRRQVYQQAKATHQSLVFYESPKRLLDSLGDAIEIFGGKHQAAICRELTKKFEEIRRGSLESLYQEQQADPVRGEVVLVLAPAAAEIFQETDVIEELRVAMTHHRVKDATKLVGEKTGWSRGTLYQLALEIKGEQEK